MKDNILLYLHKKPNGDVFYIGIGKPNRPFSKLDRNIWWSNIVNKFGYEVEIIKENLSWGEACILEKEYIKKYGRKDLGLGELVNLTDGGEGSYGYKHTEESKNKKRGPNNFMYGKKHIEDSINKIKEKRKTQVFSEERNRKVGESASVRNKGKTSPRKGVKLSEETKEKMRQSHLDKKLPPRSEEYKQNMSKAMKEAYALKKKNL